jgi:hypothetical protein
MHFHGPLAGAHNDNLLLGESDLNQLMMDSQDDAGIWPYNWAYTNRSYANS